MATEVGTAYVAVIPSARGFARNLQKDIAREFAGSKLDKLVAEELGKVGGVKLPVEPVLDEANLPRVLQPHRPVKMPVHAELQVDGFHREVERATSNAGRRAKVKVDVEPDVDRNRFAALLATGVAGAVSQMATGAQAVAGMASSMVSSVTGVVASLAGLAAGATFAVPAVYLLGGALGSLPAIAAGAAAAIGALAIGFMGIAEAFSDTGKAAGGAGESVAAQARRVAQATRGVESAQRALARAQREVVDAQRAVTRARQAEVERLQDLDRSVRSARLGEEDAALRVLEAEQQLNEARRGGDYLEIRRAELAYRQAVLGVEDARDATEDLTKEQAQSAKVGVEGSEQVQAALQRQQDAIEAATAAQEGLLSAEENLQAALEKPPGGGGAAEELIRLAPAAQEFVDQVKALKPAFEDLRLNVQQRLFAGLGGTVRNLATAWLPQLNTTLGRYADTFNGLARRAASSLSQRSFIDNMAAGAESARVALKRIGDAVSGPLVDAFGRLARAAGPFVERIGDELAGLIEDFSGWIAGLDDSGSLDRFFDRASDIFSDLIDMGRDIASIFGSVMSILFGEEETTTSPWESAKKTLDNLAAWFRDPENQQKIRDFIGDLKQAAIDIGQATITVSGWVQQVSDWINKVTGWRDAITGGWDGMRAAVEDRIDSMIGFFRNLPERVRTALNELPGKAREKFVEMAGQVGHALGTATGAWINTMIGLPGRIAGALTSLPGRLAAVWRQARDRVLPAVRDLITKAVDVVTGLPGRAARALVNIGTTLVRAGRELISGFIRGIREQVPALDGLLRWITDRIPEWKGPMSRDRELLRPSGQAIMGSLVAGISDGVPGLEQQLADVTTTVSGDLAAGLAVGSHQADPAGLGVPVIAFGGDAPESFISWVRDNVRIRYGGSTQVAFGS